MAASEYTSLETYRTFKRIADADTTNDAFITLLIPMISRGIDAYCHRHFWPKTETQVYDWQDTRLLWLRDDLDTITELTHFGGVSFNLDHLMLYPLQGPPYRKLVPHPAYGELFLWSYTKEQAITITGVWGKLENGKTPAMIQWACNAWLSYIQNIMLNHGATSTQTGNFSTSFSLVTQQLASGPPGEVVPLLKPFVWRDVRSPMEQHLGERRYF